MFDNEPYYNGCYRKNIFSNKNVVGQEHAIWIFVCIFGVIGDNKWLYLFFLMTSERVFKQTYSCVLKILWSRYIPAYTNVRTSKIVIPSGISLPFFILLSEAMQVFCKQQKAKSIKSYGFQKRPVEWQLTLNFCYFFHFYVTSKNMFQKIFKRLI